MIFKSTKGISSHQIVADGENEQHSEGAQLVLVDCLHTLKVVAERQRVELHEIFQQ